jgi:predicted nucleic acid-binding Zn ribbon protein
MDEADRAEQHEQMARDIALAQRKPVPPSAAHGHCMNCGTPLAAELVYCDRDCQIDHERAESARARNGR